MIKINFKKINIYIYYFNIFLKEKHFYYIFKQALDFVVYIYCL